MTFDWFFRIIWGDLAQVIIAIATAALAWAAWRGLSTWKEQAKTNLKIQMLDKLIDEVHSYMDQINRPIELLKIFKLMIEANTSSQPQDEEENRLNSFIKYIQKEGSVDSEMLKTQLIEAGKTKIRIISLATKGQIFEFEEYSKFYLSCRKLVHTHDQLMGFAVTIGQTEWNFENEEIRTTLSNVLETTPSEIQNTVNTSNVEIIDYLKNYYSKLI